MRAQHYIQHNANLKKDVNAVLAEAGIQYSGTARLRHLLDIIINDVGLDVVAEKVTRPLDGLRVAAYYGCCQGMWTYAQFDSTEDPTCFDRLLGTLGADVVYYPLKQACCGGTLSMSKRRVGAPLIGDLLLAAVAAGADCMVTACPLCTFNLNSFQKQAGKAKGAKFNMPALFVTQVMGLAFGLPPKSIGLHRNVVSPEPVYRKIAAGATSSTEAVASATK
jgi:heterodisulfide reductase subunit B